MSGLVVQVGTFSKILAPGLRLGWIIASDDLIDQLVRAKQGMDLHTSTLCQYTALEVLGDRVLDSLLPRLRAVYRDKRDLMLKVLAEQMPPTVSWTRPEGGMFLLMTLAPGISGHLVAQRAIESGVAVVPGVDFHVHGGDNTIRLNFSYPGTREIKDGITKLASVIRNIESED
jgi:2-aminoadipate transaminase